MWNYGVGYGTNQLDIIKCSGRDATKRSKEAKKKLEKGALKSEELEGSWTRWTAFTSCHERIAVQLQLYLEVYETQDWFTTVRAV